MKKSILIAGFESLNAENLLRAAVSSGRKVFSAQADSNGFDVAGVETIGWNRKSPISSRSVVLRAKNSDCTFDEFLCVFDGPALAARFVSDEISAYADALNAITLSAVYICKEVIRFFEQQKQGRIIFLLREAEIFDPAEKENFDACSAPVAMAQMAFEAFAQTIKGKFLDAPLKITLVRDVGIESIDNWLFPFLEESEKNNPQNWVKVGAKQKSGFHFFRR